MTARPNRLNGLRHLALVVEEFEACEAFYRDILGMEVLSRAHENLVYLTLGNDNLSLARARPGAGMATKNGTLDHFGFIVDSKEDLAAWYDFMVSEGCDLMDQPHDHKDGAKSFHVCDPAGNVVQPLYHPAISGQTFDGAS